MFDAPPVVQQQQQPQQIGAATLRVQVRYMIPDDEQALLPRRPRAPAVIPPEAPIPRAGEVVYLSSSSAWRVDVLVHEWRSPVDLCIEVWMSHLGAARATRPPWFGLTQ